MSAAFTPGPWIANGKGWEVRADGGRMKVCDIRGWGYLTGKGDTPGLPDEQAIAIQAANERLIAAAPDLHRALSDLLELVRVHGLEPCNDLPMHEFEAIVDGVVQDAGRALNKVLAA